MGTGCPLWNFESIIHSTVSGWVREQPGVVQNSSRKAPSPQWSRKLEYWLKGMQEHMVPQGLSGLISSYSYEMQNFQKISLPWRLQRAKRKSLLTEKQRWLQSWIVQCPFSLIIILQVIWMLMRKEELKDRVEEWALRVGRLLSTWKHQYCRSQWEHSLLRFHYKY